MPATIGPYVVCGVIGQGASGRVYDVLAPDGARLALKRLRRGGESGDASGLRTSLKEEYRLVADLFHPNLVLPHALETDGEGAFFTMERIEGVGFVEALHAGPPSPPETIADALVQLCSGLAALHRAGLVHRDVKPSNVLVERGGRVAILDFGLAGALAASEAGGPVGTPAYLAPEILWGEPATPASDAYAVGVMLHEVLTGRLPFDADVDRCVSLRANQDPPPPVDGPPALSRLCAGLLEPSPLRRLDVIDVLAALDAPAALHLIARRTPDLIAREDELERLEAAWTLARERSTPVVVTLPGRSGMGKSALLRALRARLAGRALVLEARSYERDAVPHKAIDAAIDELASRVRPASARHRAALGDDDARELAAIFPVLGDALAVPSGASSRDLDPRTRRLVAARALATILRTAGDDAPSAGEGGVALLLDDVHWGDLDSARFLVDLLSSDPGPLLVVLAHRTDATATSFGEAIGRWARDTRSPLVEVPVAPLAPDAARLLADAVAPDAAAAARLVERADGCPLLLEMLAEGEARSEQDLESMLSHRLAALPSHARRALEVVCLAGRPVARSRVVLAVGDTEDTWRTWAALARGRMIRSCGPSTSPSVEPYHDRIRDGVAHTMDAAERAAAHLRLGDAFAASPADEEGAAIHLALGGAHARALAFARSAARSALAALAFDRAARFLELALHCAPGDEPEVRGALEIELARALASAGRGTEAAPLFLRQAARARGLVASDLRREAMEQLLVAGRVDEGRAVMDALLGELSPWRPRSPAMIQLVLVAELARLVARGPRLAPPRPLQPADRLVLETFLSIGKGMSSYDASLGTWFFLRAARRALDAGSYEHAVRGVAFTGSVLGFLGHVAAGRAARWIEAGDALARSHGDAHGSALCDVARGMIECCSGAWPRSLATFDRAAAVLRDHPASSWESATARTTALFVLMQLGDLPELGRRAEAMAREGRERSDLTLQVESDLYLALIALADDDPEAAEACIERNLAEWTTRDYLFQSWIALRFRTLARLYAGRWEEALAGVDDALPRARAANLTAMQVVRIEAADLHGRAALAGAMRTGGARRASLLRVVEEDARALDRERCRHGSAPAAVLRAGIREIAGDRAGALATLESARASYADASMHAHALAAAWHAARLAGDLEGRRAAEGGLVACGIREPARWATMHLGVEAC